ncbi:hypothetical protein [Pseudomonas viridiflava]|uniref:hypothetical protein n=1 Tax=Pseudomonas viridiflava TaxID=33069 RepID=UPI003B75B330
MLPALGSKHLEEITRASCAELQTTTQKRGEFKLADKIVTWLKQIFNQTTVRGLREKIRLPSSTP